MYIHNGIALYLFIALTIIRLNDEVGYDVRVNEVKFKAQPH